MWKVENISEISTTKTVNALGVVSDDHKIPVNRRKQFYEIRLGPVRILKLIDKYVSTLSRDPGSDALELFE